MQAEFAEQSRPVVKKPQEITVQRILLVEGKDEVAFFEALLRHLGLKERLQTLDIGGKEKLSNAFPAFLNLPGSEHVSAYAIIQDADISQTATFNSIKGLLQKYGQPCPSRNKEFAETNSIKVGVFIMPGNAETGMLENLCLQTVADHPAMSCVTNYMGCLRANLIRKHTDAPKDSKIAYFPKNEDKAQLLAFLSSMHEPTTSIGMAAQKGYWSFDHEALSDLRNFLKKLAE